MSRLRASEKGFFWKLVMLLIPIVVISGGSFLIDWLSHRGEPLRYHISGVFSGVLGNILFAILVYSLTSMVVRFTSIRQALFFYGQRLRYGQIFQKSSIEEASNKLLQAMEFRPQMIFIRFGEFRLDRDDKTIKGIVKHREIWDWHIYTYTNVGDKSPFYYEIEELKEEIGQKGDLDTYELLKFRTRIE